GPDEVQAETHTGCCRSAPPAAEAVEHEVDVFGVDSGAPVENAQAYGGAGLSFDQFGLHVHHPAAVHERVVDEVDEDALQRGGIGHHLEALRHAARDLAPGGPLELEHLAHQWLELEWTDLNRGAGARLLELEDVLDEPQELLALAADHLEELAAHVRVELAPLQGLHTGEDRCQRRPQLVAHRR